jgi:O-antigen ligase
MAARKKQIANKQKKGSKKKINIRLTTIKNESLVEKYLPTLALVVVGILIFFPPYFRGLFFNPEMFATHIMTGFILILILAVNWDKRTSFLQSPMDWAVLAFALSYLLSLIGAVHPGDALYGFLRVLNYVTIYWIVSRVIRDFKDMETLTRVILASGTGVAAIGILAALGWSAYPGAFDGRVILSTLQYPNATAAYLAVITLVGIALWTREKRWGIQCIYLLAGAFMSLVVLASLSKGAWLIYIAGALLLVIGMPGIFKVKALYGLAISFLAGLAGFVKFYPAITAGGEGAVRYLLLSFLTVAVGLALWWLLSYLHQTRGTKTTVLSLVLILVILMTPLLTLGRNFIAEQNIAQEISGMVDLKSSTSYISRADFYGWGWEIVKDYPLNGTGAGGWNALYHQYQDYLVWTTEVHNHFLQVWIEAGTIGFLTWISIIGVLLWYLIRLKRRSERDEWVLIWGLASAVLALLAHSVIDFDLSIPAITIVLWSLLAMINWGYQSVEKPLLLKYGQFINPVLVILLSITLLFSGSKFLCANSYALKGVESLRQLASNQTEKQNEFYVQTTKNLRKAVKLNPYNAEYQAEWAYINAIGYMSAFQQNNPSANLLNKMAMDGIRYGQKMRPNDTKIRARLLQSAMLLGDVELAKQQAEEAVLANPLDIGNYNLLVNVLWEGCQYYDKLEKKDLVRSYATELTKLDKRVKQQRDRINPDRPWNGNPLELSPEIKEKIDKAQKYL